MADVYIPPPPQQYQQSAPQHGVPGAPVSNIDAAQIFGLAPPAPGGQPGVGRPPVANADAAVIFGGGVPIAEGSPGVISSGSRDVTFARNYGPISNDDRATIYGDGPREPRTNLLPPPPPIQTNLEVRFIPGPQPIENDPTRSIMHGPPRLPEPQEQSPFYNPFTIPDRTPVSNEGTRFTHAPGPMYTGDTFIPPPPTRGADYISQKSDVINVGNSDVQILPGKPAINVQGDVTFGGGGDQTKLASGGEVHYGGKHSMDVGSTDVFKALSGDPTREAGAEDKTFAPMLSVIGNQEAYNGARGEPTANLDHNDVAFGAVGKPKNVKG